MDTTIHGDGAMAATMIHGMGMATDTVIGIVVVIGQGITTAITTDGIMATTMVVVAVTTLEEVVLLHKKEIIDLEEGKQLLLGQEVVPYQADVQIT